MLGQEWRPHTRREGFYVDLHRPGWMRDRAGNWFADPDGPLYWFRDDDGRIVYLEAPHEPSAAERQGELNEDPALARTLEWMRRRIRGER